MPFPIISFLIAQRSVNVVNFALFSEPPPFAATVWLRMGKTLLITATFLMPFSMQERAHINPAPPEPMIIASKLCWEAIMSKKLIT